MASSRLLLSFVTVALTVSCGGGGGSSGLPPGGSGSGSGGSGGGSTEVTKDFTVASTGVSTSRPSNGDAVAVDMSSITQSGSVTVTQ
ncbi:hypothetical protein N8993_14715 [Pseudomonadales bacterium]|nr:hypothetical protein [Pseudomonadales bacterium]